MFSKETGAEFDFHVYSGNYAGEGRTYSYESSAYVDKKMVKLQKARYNAAKNIDFFKNPDNLFPAKKLKKLFNVSGKSTGEAKKYTKKDFEARLKNELFAKNTSKDFWSIQLKGEQRLVVYRMTYMNFGTWSINGLYEGKYKRIAQTDKIVTFYETYDQEYKDKNFDAFIDFLKKAKAGKFPPNFWKYK